MDKKQRKLIFTGAMAFLGAAAEWHQDPKNKRKKAEAVEEEQNVCMAIGCNVPIGEKRLMCDHHSDLLPNWVCTLVRHYHAGEHPDHCTVACLIAVHVEAINRGVIDKEQAAVRMAEATAAFSPSIVREVSSFSLQLRDGE